MLLANSCKCQGVKLLSLNFNWRLPHTNFHWKLKRSIALLNNSKFLSLNATLRTKIRVFCLMREGSVDKLSFSKHN